MSKRMLNCRSILLGALLFGAVSTSAFAGALVTWRTASDPSCDTDAACTSASGITAGDLTSNIPLSAQSGYVTHPYAWSVAGSSYVSGADMQLTVTTASALTISTFDFSIFNNDCENGGTPIYGCQTATWAVQDSINAGQWSADLFTFYSGAPYAKLNFSVGLNQFLNAGDALTMRIYNVNAGSGLPGTGQYVFSNVALMPEPASLALLGLGLAGLGFSRRKKT